MVRPVLDTTASPRLRTTQEGNPAPAATSVAELLSGSGRTGDTGAPLGIAITALDTSLGLWQYSLDHGKVWLTLRADLINGSTAETALLLGADAKLRLLPFGELNGHLDQAITFRAWNGRMGAEGEYLNITRSNVSVFSAESGTAEMTVEAVNDAPTFTVIDPPGLVRTHFDRSFGNGTTVLLQPDGKVVLVGFDITAAGKVRIEAVRLQSDGQIDTGFGQNGIAYGQLGSAMSLTFDAALQPDGKIVVSGFYLDEEQFQNGGAMRFNADGSTAETALLLGADAKLRLLPFGELNGHLDQAITFRAWNSWPVRSALATTAPTAWPGSWRTVASTPPSDRTAYSARASSCFRCLIS
ncbi:MAG: hypothetical protein EOO22_08095 [Comamonadaceae bacterium]|nr:MAG: hypothetical protein EOO22_08095 [Comamonadaceae bacterium]